MSTGILKACAGVVVVVACSELGAIASSSANSILKGPGYAPCPTARAGHGIFRFRIAARPGRMRNSGHPSAEETQHRIDDVELTYGGGDQETRVVLSSAGAARIDIKSAANKGLPPRTILIPVREPKAVVRIATMVVALADASVDVKKAQWGDSNPDGTLAIRCRVEGDSKVRTIRMRKSDLAINPVWRGVIEEIQVAGSVPLATAIDEFEDGESHLAKGEREKAVAAYQDAVNTLDDWERADFLRTDGPGGIYEPEVGIEFKYPGQEPSGWRVVRGVPRNVKELPGIDLEWAVRLLRHGWNRYIEMNELAIAESDDVYIVGWNEIRGGEDDPRVLRPPVAIPSRVVDALKQIP